MSQWTLIKTAHICSTKPQKPRHHHEFVKHTHTPPSRTMDRSGAYHPLSAFSTANNVSPDGFVLLIGNAWWTSQRWFSRPNGHNQTYLGRAHRQSLRSTLSWKGRPSRTLPIRVQPCLAHMLINLFKAFGKKASAKFRVRLWWCACVTCTLKKYLHGPRERRGPTLSAPNR